MRLRETELKYMAHTGIWGVPMDRIVTRLWGSSDREWMNRWQRLNVGSAWRNLE
jgi:hypothetical protein